MQIDAKILLLYLEKIEILERYCLFLDMWKQTDYM